MSKSKKQSLLEAVLLTAQSRKTLKKTYSVILDSVGKASNYDKNGFLTQSLSSINECSDMMSMVGEALAEIWERIKPTFSFQLSKPSSHREQDDSYTPFDDRYLREAVDQSKLAFTDVEGVYNLLLGALGVAETRDDNETLYKNLKTVEECKTTLYSISNTLSEINDHLEQIELEALYAPPSFFGGE